MGKQKQKQRKKINNYNPYNKLQLNKFHQIGAKAHASQSWKLNKKKRDIQRLIKHKQKMQKMEGGDQEQAKTQLTKKNEQLQKINTQLTQKKKTHQKDMRKQFFLKNKYKQIMEIQMRKVNKRIKALKQGQTTEQTKKQLAQWEKKQRYIKFFPKTLKYVSLFPNNKPLEQKAKEFQQKIMEEIEQTYRKRLLKKNQYISQNIKTKKSQRNANKKDNFFIRQQQEQQREQEQNNSQEQEQEQEQIDEE